MSSRKRPRWADLIFALGVLATFGTSTIYAYLCHYNLPAAIGFVCVVTYISFLFFAVSVNALVESRKLGNIPKRIATLTPAMKKAIGIFVGIYVFLLGGVAAATAVVIRLPFGLRWSIGVAITTMLAWSYFTYRIARSMNEHMKEKTKEALKQAFDSTEKVFEKVNDDEDHKMYGVWYTPSDPIGVKSPSH